MKRIYSSFSEAFADIQDGARLMIGGFGLCGIPKNLIAALVEKDVKNLTIISHHCGIDDDGLGILLKNQQIKKMIGSYVGENQEFERQVLARELEVELLPQGPLAEKIRAGGAGLSTFHTPASMETRVPSGKEMRFFYGKNYLLEEALTADFSIIRAWKGDRLGNLVYHKTARNFNSMMAAAGKITIAEVEQLVETGELEADHIHTSGRYVEAMIEMAPKKRIQRLAIEK